MEKITIVETLVQSRVLEGYTHTWEPKIYTPVPDRQPTLQSPCFVWTTHISKWISCTLQSGFQDPEIIRIRGRISLGLIRAWDT